jgi:hypothetical protein
LFGGFHVAHLFRGLGLWYFTPLSTTFQLYCGGHFYWWRKLEYPEKTTDCRKSLKNFYVFFSCPIICLYVLSSMLWNRYDFRVKTMFGSSLPDIDLWGLMSYLRYLCLCAHSGVQHILCCVFVLFVFVLCTLCCKFICIVHFYFPIGIF